MSDDIKPPMPLNQRVNEDIVEAATRAWWEHGRVALCSWDEWVKRQLDKEAQSCFQSHVMDYRTRMEAALAAVLPTIIDRVKRGFLS